MADLNITQAEADALIAVEKHCLESEPIAFPDPGGRMSLELTTPDQRETFTLDASRGRIKLAKATYQNRLRQAIILLRLDLEGPPHRNPDDTEVPCPHLHIYREGYGDKWAVPAPSIISGVGSDLFTTFDAFLSYCNVTRRPEIQRVLF